MPGSSRLRTPFIVLFYKAHEVGQGAQDSEGRTLEDILQFDDQDLEYNHDYIQVLFPLPERSPVNPDAPIITKPGRDAFLEDEDLRKRLALAFEKMAHFYGFDVCTSDSGPVITPKPDFAAIASRSWLTRMDHNHLRISRIIRSLRILGLESLALAFYKAVTDNANGVSSRSQMYWKRAAERPLHLAPSEDDENAKGIAWLKEDEES